jgi:hypothetical protein
VLTFNGNLKLSAAFEQLAGRTQWSFKTLRNAHDDARNCVHILELDSPGHLLRLGSKVNWL